MQMPEMNGVEVHAEISGRQPALPVIFMTAQDAPHFRQAAVRAGVRLLLKPFRASLLLSAVESACERSAAATRRCG
jgi:FixJ family two-component response regulator